MTYFSKLCTSVITFIMLFGTQLTATGQGAGQQGLVIAPSIQEVEATPGRIYDIDYSIRNNTDIESLVTDVKVETFQEGDIQGSANVIPFTPENDRSNWLEVPSKQIFPKDQTSRMSYQLRVPENAEPGAYFFAIVYQPRQEEIPQNDKNNVLLQTRLAALLFVNIGGDTSKRPTIIDYTVNPQWVDPIFDTLNISYQVEVKGASFYRPVGNLFLSEDNSDSITTLATILSDNLILPGGKRSYSQCFGSNIFSKKCEGNTPSQLPLFGVRNIDLRLDYSDGEGNPQSDVAQRKVIFFPYKTTLLLFAGLLIALTIGFWITKPKK